MHLKDGKAPKLIASNISNFRQYKMHLIVIVYLGCNSTDHLGFHVVADLIPHDQTHTYVLNKEINPPAIYY